METLNASVSGSLAKVNDALNKLNDTAKKTNEQVSSSFQNLQKTAGESFNNLATAVQGSFGKISGIVGEFRNKVKTTMELIAVGFVFGESIHQTISWAKEIRELSMTMGMTSGAASNLNVALRLVGISTEEYATMAMKLSRQIRTNEPALNKLGLTTRDAAGHLRPLNELMIDAMKSNGNIQGRDGPRYRSPVRVW